MGRGPTAQCDSGKLGSLSGVLQPRRATDVDLPGRISGTQVASHLQNGTPGLLGIKVIAIPYESDGITVDEIAARELIEKKRPGLLMLGSTLVLNGRYPERLIARARSLGTTVAHDASHVAGLIAGHQMRSPFDAGVEIITASTYK